MQALNPLNAGAKDEFTVLEQVNFLCQKCQKWKKEDAIHFYGKDVVNQLGACDSNEISTGWSTSSKSTVPLFLLRNNGHYLESYSGDA